MSEPFNPRDQRTIAIVLGLGALLGLLQVFAYHFLADLSSGDFTPISWQVILITLGVADAAGTGDTWWLFSLVGGVLLFFGTTLVALLPVLLAAACRKFVTGFLLGMFLLASALTWWSMWPIPEWRQDNRLRLPIALVNLVMAVACCAAWLAWRRNPEGRAAFWYPVAMQTWLQCFWLPFPDDG